MTYPEKQKLYEIWLKEWGTRLEKIPSLLKYVSLYPDLLPAPGVGKECLVDDDLIHESQLEWVSLLAQLDNPIETTYFKNYWVPFPLESWDFFIDLSSNDYPIFESRYFMGEPYQWYKTYLVKSIPDLLHKIDNPAFNLEKYKSKNEEDARKKLDELFEDHDELGYAGKLELPEYIRSWMFPEALTISNIKPLIIALLPLQTALKINNINTFHNRYDDANPKIKTIKGFAHLMIVAIHSNVTHYHVTLSNNRKCYARYKNNTITIKHHNLALLSKVIEQIPKQLPDDIPF